MFEFKTDCRIFHDHLGQPHEKPDKVPIVWRPSAYALVSAGDQILMVEPVCTPGFWTLPGGGVEPNEALLDGLARECREEVGQELMIEPQAPLYLGEHDFYFKWTDEYMHSLVLVFAATLASAKVDAEGLVPPDPKEIKRISWLSLNDLNDGNCHFVVMPVLARYRRAR